MLGKLVWWGAAMSGHESWFWVFVFGIMWMAVYTTYKRPFPAIIFLLYVMLLDYLFGLLPPYVVPFVYIFIAITIATSIIFKLLNLRNNV